MAERRPTIPANSSLLDFKNVKLILSPTSSNNHGSEITGLTLPPGQIQFTQISKNVGKIHTTPITASTSLIKTINHPKISTLGKGLTILQPASTQQPPQPQSLAHAKLITQHQQNSSPNKIIIQTLNINPMLSKIGKPQIPKSLSTISFSNNNTSIGNNTLVTNNNNVSGNNNNNVIINNPSSGTQVFQIIRGDQNTIKPVTPIVKQGNLGTLPNKSKSLSIVNPSQVTKVTPQPITSQRLILPATSQVQAALATNSAIFQGVATPTTLPYLATSTNQTQGFAFVQSPTVITPSNKHSAPSESSGGSSENLIHSNNENSMRAPSRQQQWIQSEPITNLRQRKPCNCTKSQCLKLYCECFANGEFCKDCNCCNCANNLEHEEERTRAIKSCMERNPHAFHPKIGKGGSNRHHNKGCNCKRSGCLKNYCECYEAKILCSNLCRCIGCRNYEESVDRQKLMQLADAAEVRVQQQTAAETKLSLQILGTPMKPQAIASNGQRAPYTFVTLDVIEAISYCLIAEADDNQLNEAMQERQILEEYGRCLSQVIDMASKTRASSP